MLDNGLATRSVSNDHCRRAPGRATTAARRRCERRSVTPRAARLDLSQIESMHPLLPPTTAHDLVTRAAVALQRRNHQPGDRITAVLPGSERRVAIELRWELVPAEFVDRLDERRITEDGAEAVALALVSVRYGWVVRRRLQQGESADWLLRDPDGGLIALEVSGVDGDRDTRRVTAKLDQVSRCTAAGRRAACVVAFGPPFADLADL